MSMRHVLRRGNPPLRPSRGLLRPRSVRAKVVALLMVPVFSLMVLWALATVSTVQDAWTLRQLNELNTNLAAPAGDLVSSLQAERASVTRHLAEAGGPVGEDVLAREHARTEAALRALQGGVSRASADVRSLAPAVSRRIQTLARDVDGLRAALPDVASRQRDWTRAFSAYSAAIQSAFAVSAALVEVRDASPGRSVLPLAQVEEMLARQDAVASAAPASVPMTHPQYRAFTSAVGAQRVLSANLLSELRPAERAAYERLLGSGPYRSLTAIQDDALDHPLAGRALFGDRWARAVDTVTRDLGGIQADARAAAGAETASASESALTEGLLTVVFGLLAVLAALLISVWVGRGLVLELVELRNSALELANRRLPQAMRKLRAGEKIDVDADVPVVPKAEGEVGQVGDALNAVQRAALQAAAERAELLTGVSGVFVTLARRSQSLVHRQLALLDRMERKIDDAEQLEDLFRLDHLAARMRRHAEGLIIMSGAPPGRAWAEPVPLMTVVRAAVAEVEDYQRVHVLRMADVLVSGAVVADLTHMIAELVENATSFSPPNTSVLVHGEPVGAGFVVEIEDRGLGMRPESLAQANQRIAEAHRFDLLDGEQLGFFVISRLARRRGITVTLRHSPFGGITAVLLLPKALLTGRVQVGAAAEPARAVERFAGRLGATSVRATAVRELPARTEARHDPSPAEERLVQDSGPESAVGHVDPGDDVTGGLPRRRRQANLAPGLRHDEGGGGSTTGDERGATSGDSSSSGTSSSTWPEQAAATLAALQQGLDRGRRDDSRQP